MLYVIGGGTDHGPLTYQWYGPNGFVSLTTVFLIYSRNLFGNCFRYK